MSIRERTNCESSIAARGPTTRRVLGAKHDVLYHRLLLSQRRRVLARIEEDQ